MHIYIYDHFLKQNKLEKIVSKIETRITDLGLNGKNCYVGPLKSLKSIVTDELRNKPKTIIAVGDNETLNHIINSLGEADITVGIIPVGPNNSIAKALGIPNEDTACNVISARLIEVIDLGIINNTYFISSAIISTQGTIIEVNEQYTVEPVGIGNVEIINLNTYHKDSIINPQDAKIETFIDIKQKGLLSKPRSSRTSFIRSNNLIINNLNKHDFIVDNALEIKAPAHLTVAPAALSIIVGKERSF